MSNGESIPSRFQLEVLPAALPDMRWVLGIFLELKRPQRVANLWPPLVA